MILNHEILQCSFTLLGGWYPAKLESVQCMCMTVILTMILLFNFACKYDPRKIIYMIWVALLWLALMTGSHKVLCRFGVHGLSYGCVVDASY